MRKFLLSVLCVLSAAAVSAVQLNTHVFPARCGLNNGIVTAWAINGLPPYSYAWSNGPSTASQSGLAPGDYTVTVTDGLNNTAEATLTVEAVFALSNDFDVQRLACEGACSGILDVSRVLAGGTAPFTWSSSPSLVSEFCLHQDSEELHCLCGGLEYDITIVDANGCSGTISLIMMSTDMYGPSALDVSPECNGQANGSITMDGSAAMYEVSDGQGWAQQYVVTESPFTISGLSAGNYLVMAYGTDENNNYAAAYCTVPSSVVVEAIGSPCGSVSGQVFHDADQNCLFNGVDLGLPYRVLTIEPGPEYVLTGFNGRYQRSIEDGSYTISQNLVDAEQLCPPQQAAPFTVDALQPEAVVDMADSSFLPHDLAVHLWQSAAARPGFSFSAIGQVRNLSAYPGGPVTATMAYDPTLTPTSVFPSPSAQSPGTIQWNLGTVVGYGLRDIRVAFSVPADITLLGQTMDVVLSETNAATESSSLNNAASFSATIVGSYDPNDKTATTSSGLSTTQYFLDQDAHIDYVIRFQNTGTAAASIVVIRDTLEQDLDPTSLQIIRSSHNFTPSFETGRVLKFTFENINLPDSGTNEQLSHGSVLYRIRPRADIQLGEVISNHADIYFDLNPPVITEPSELMVELSTALKPSVAKEDMLRLMPNPVHDELRVAFEQGRGGTMELTVRSADGRLCVQEIRSTLPAMLHVSHLPQGVYVLELRDATGKAHRASFVKH